MNGSKKGDPVRRKKESKTSRITLYLAASLIVIVIAYFTYLILKPTVTPCDGVFQQTAARLQSNIEIFEVKAEIFLSNEQVQELSVQAQRAALHLKTCCILFQGYKISFNQFIQCQNSFNIYQHTFGRVSTIVADAGTAKKKQTLPAAKSRLLQKLEKELKILDQKSKDLGQLVSESSSDDDQFWAEKKTIINETEPNNQFTEAMQIASGMIRGELSEADKADYYRFNVSHGHIIKLAFTPDEEGETMFLYLKNFERKDVWNSGLVAPGVTKSISVMMNSSSGGTYYIKVHGGSGQYEFELSTENQNDAGSAGDAGDKITRALQIETGRSFKGELGEFDREDWYQFKIPDGYILKLDFAPDEEGEAMFLNHKNFERKVVWYSGLVAPGVTKSISVMMNSSSGGTYYVNVYGGSGQYEFELSTENQNDAGSTGDAGDKITKALQIETGRSFLGELGGFDKEDWYRFMPVEGQLISFTPGEEGNSMFMNLKNFERKNVWYFGSVAPGVTKSFRISKVVMPPYFIKVYGGSGTYTFEIK